MSIIITNMLITFSVRNVVKYQNFLHGAKKIKYDKRRRNSTCE